jgi:hypothetical protein
MRSIITKALTVGMKNGPEEGTKTDAGRREAGDDKPTNDDKPDK